MVRSGSQYVQLSGPLFADDVKARFKGAVGDGIRELGKEGEGIMQSFIYQSGFIDSGDFVSSVEAEFVRTRGIGYATVAPRDQWPAPGRPPRIWYERGTRRGKKLRKAGGGFAKTRTRLRQMSYQGIADRIAKVLN